MSKYKPNFITKDYFKSQEKFELVWDEAYQIFKTQPQPDAKEIGKYYDSEAYISHSNQIKNLMDLAYGVAKQLMLKKKLSWVNSIVKKKASILDIGCGTGDVLWLLQKNKFEVQGIEPNAKARKIAQEKDLQIHADLKEVKDTFDLISMFHVLEHVHDPFSYVEDLHQYLNSDAYVMVAVPNFNSYDANYYQEHWAAFDVPRHLFHFSAYGIKKLFQERGFLFIEQKPLILDAYYVSLLSEKYKGSNSKLKALQVAWKSNSLARTSNEWSSQLYVFKKAK
ncbi:MAG: class I SAM-dependent methyltransferase [Flavobacteriaceae bacterium]|nr:class I SAM-dependent methyltransferase [Flavobacteriaceae bacterium]